MLDPSDPRHGTASGYGARCRCDLCRAANATYQRTYQRNRRDPWARALSPIVPQRFKRRVTRELAAARDRALQTLAEAA